MATTSSEADQVCREFQASGREFLEVLARRTPEPWQQEYTHLLAAHFPAHCDWFLSTFQAVRTLGGIPYAAFLDRLAVLTRQVRRLTAEIGEDRAVAADTFELAIRFEEEILTVRKLFLGLPLQAVASRTPLSWPPDLG